MWFGTLVLWPAAATNCLVFCLNPTLGYVNTTYEAPVIAEHCGRPHVLAFVDPSTAPELENGGRGGADRGDKWPDDGTFGGKAEAVPLSTNGRLFDSTMKDALQQYPVRSIGVASFHWDFIRGFNAKGLKPPGMAYLVPRTADDVDGVLSALQTVGVAPNTWDVVIEGSCPLGDAINRDDEAALLRQLLAPGGTFVQKPYQHADAGDATSTVGTRREGEGAGGVVLYDVPDVSVEVASRGASRLSGETPVRRSGARSQHDPGARWAAKPKWAAWRSDDPLAAPAGWVNDPVKGQMVRVGPGDDLAADLSKWKGF